MSELFNEKEIRELMEKLSKKRPVFYSEDDFKFSLAWEIKEKYRDDVEIILEKKMNNKNASSSEEGDHKNKNQRIDIFIRVKNENDIEKIGIELKYYTAKLEWQDNRNGETFILASQDANDLRCYDAWKDVERLENFIDKGFINKGFAIWLTNVNSLTKDCIDIENENKNTANYDEFRICNKRIINGPKKMDWKKTKKTPSKGTIKGREKPITIKGNYKVYWKEYTDLSNEQKNINEKSSYKRNSNKVFKYAILGVIQGSG